MAYNKDAHNSSTSPDTVGFTGYPSAVKATQTYYSNVHNEQLAGAAAGVPQPRSIDQAAGRIPVFDAITGKRQN